MTVIHYGLGAINAGEQELVYIPRNLRFGSDTPGVILAHGAGSVDIEGIDWLTISKLIYVITEAGFPVIQGAMGGDTYANDAISGSASTSHMNEALAVLVARTGCAARAHLFGLSMGAGVAIRYAGLNPAKVATVTGGIPMTNIDYLYQSTNIGGVNFRPGIQTAWGVVHPAALPASADLIGVHAPAIAAANIPNRMFNATDDPYVRASDVNAFLAASGGELYQNTGGHTAAFLAKMETINGGADWSDQVEWMIENS